MKYRILLFLVLSFQLFLSACTSKEADNDTKEQSDEVVYYGKGEEWLATFSIFKVNRSMFDSIYIQNIGENRGAKGSIEYQLVGGDGFKFESQYPQELRGVRSFHTSSEFNSDVISIKPTADGVFELTIKYNGKMEKLKLKNITAPKGA
ncbi:hypothetical protein [Cohnella sp. OV330]|uniref:hypothetical protein n=1 Tax=Cohnella sp. OV330 TaxID=1855288 RepID=UPI000B7ED07B|nr:hypothetical protein [Cohnella sp. OV330]